MSMRLRQKQRPDLYPKWQRKKNSPARQAKARDGWVCVDCGKSDREVYTNEDGELCIRYLHGGHLHPLDPDYWQVEPIEGQRLRARCPRCHRIYDIHWRTRQEEVDHQCRMHGILRTRFFEARFLRVL